MAEKKISKVVYNGNTLIDLTADTVVADKLLTGYTAHGKDGELVTGTCAFNVDATDATAAASEILATKTAYVGSAKVTGSMTNNGAVTGTISTVAGEYTIPVGYHDGSGKVSIDATEQAKIIGNNIRQGITILGVTGTIDPTQEVRVQALEATPSASQQVITPDADHDYLTQVTVKAIPYTTVENVGGGLTATIG